MATYYVSSLATGGGVGSLADPWTIHEAFNAANVVAGDIVHIMDDGTYALTSQINADVSEALYKGANSSGDVDGSQPVIDATNSGGDGIELTGGSVAFTLKNVRITGAVNFGIDISNTSGGPLFIDNCRIDHCGSGGINMPDSSTAIECFNCEVDHNGAYGVGASSQNRGNATLFNCRIHHNSTYGAWAYLGYSVIACAIYRNGNDGLIGNDSGRIIGNTFYGNGGNGAQIATSGKRVVLYNNIFAGNTGGYGFNTVGGSIEELAVCKNNCFHGNASGPIDINGGTPPGDGNILADPLFVSTVDGSEDFNLQDGSPCKNAGLGYS